MPLPQKASPLESVLAYKEMGWANDTYVDGKNITQWEGYIRDYQANPSNYPNGYIFDDIDNDWELVCFCTEDGQNSAGKPNTAPEKYVPKDAATVGVISQKSGVRFSNFKVTPAAED